VAVPGYTHTAFCFANESLVTKANINGADVPPGSLISFVQKVLPFPKKLLFLNFTSVEASYKCVGNLDSVESKSNRFPGFPYRVSMSFWCGAGQGMLYVEIEQHINDDGTEIDMSDDKMSLLIPGHLQNREAEFKEDAPEAMVGSHPPPERFS
jgi:hypothetical protein